MKIIHIGKVKLMPFGFEKTQLVYRPEKGEILKGVISTSKKATYTITIDGVTTFVADFQGTGNSPDITPNEKYMKFNNKLGFLVEISADRPFVMTDSEKIDLFFIIEVEEEENE
jgi:hypothetical protein